MEAVICNITRPTTPAKYGVNSGKRYSRVTLKSISRDETSGKFFYINIFVDGYEKYQGKPISHNIIRDRLDVGNIFENLNYTTLSNYGKTESFIDPFSLGAVFKGKSNGIK
jgi:hypothetical protein